MIIYIVGMMGSGKTRVGGKLAALLSYHFVDTDVFIEENENMTVSQLFQERGEEAFRNLEHEYLHKLASSENTVISTGGGLPCYHNHMALMNQTGITLYLEAEIPFLKSRLTSKKDKRPLIAQLTDAEMEIYLLDLLTNRKVFYEQARFRVPAKNLKPKYLIDLLKSNGIIF